MVCFDSRPQTPRQIKIQRFRYTRLYNQRKDRQLPITFDRGVWNTPWTSKAPSSEYIRK